MMQKYIDKRFNGTSLVVIEKANEIIGEYQSQGFTLTLRQLYYQFVSRDLIKNSLKEYKRLGYIINDARMAGLIDWEAIEDRTRNLRGITMWDSPADILNSVANSYKLNPWDDQKNHVEVWIEKDALVGVIEPICNELRVDYFACRGYNSQSEQHSAGQRLIQKINRGKTVTIFHFGDHDPSGIDMTRDNLERLRLFINAETDADSFNLERLALNMDQVKKYKPPPNPAKMSDSRSEGYVRIHGNKSWELDALDPKVITALIRKNVKGLIDEKIWSRSIKRENGHIEKLNEFIDQAQDME